LEKKTKLKALHRKRKVTSLTFGSKMRNIFSQYSYSKRFYFVKFKIKIEKFLLQNEKFSSEQFQEVEMESEWSADRHGTNFSALLGLILTKNLDF